MQTIATVFEVAWKIAGVLGLIGITLAGLTAFAYWLFKKFAAGWMENRFKKELADHQHQHNREIERFRGEIASLLSRATKVHEKEFETLTAAWEKLGLMVSALNYLVRKGHPAPFEVGGLTQAQMAEFIGKMGFPVATMNDLIKLDGEARQALFDRVQPELRMKKAAMSHADFSNHIITNGIFIQPDIRAKLTQIANLFGDIITTHDLIWSPMAPVPRPHDDNASRFYGEGLALRDEIDAAISARLWDVKPTVSA